MIKPTLENRISCHTCNCRNIKTATMPRTISKTSDNISRSFALINSGSVCALTNLGTVMGLKIHAATHSNHHRNTIGRTLPCFFQADGLSVVTSGSLPL